MARAGTRRADGLRRRIAACLMAVMLIAGLVPGMPLGAGVAYAEGNVYLSIERQVDYSNAYTNYMYVNGNIAFCAVPSKYTPPSGTYTTTPVDMRTINQNNSYTPQDVAAALWFGYDGPGFDASMWPGTWADGSAMNNDRYLTLTHIVLADFYTCNGMEALDDTAGTLRTWLTDHVLAAVNGGFNADTPQARIMARKGEVPPEFTANCFQINPADNKQNILSYKPGGWVDLVKTSANTDTTDQNGCYRLEGAEYGIYRNAECTDLAQTLTTDADGRARSGYLQTGAYYVKESKAPEGYALDGTVYPVAVRKGQTTRAGGDAVADVPLCSTAELLVAKLDAETGAGMAQGGATLADAQFTIRYYRGYFGSVQAAEASGDAARSWVVRTDESGRARLDDACKVSGDAFYRTSDGRAAVPLGTLLIQETKAPAGYHLSDTTVQVRQITATGTTETATAYQAPSVADQVFRGDAEFIKARESDQNRMANIPFRIRNNATKESHVVVTDANGQASTAAQWNAHTAKTNANDAAVRADGTVDESKLDPTAGVWFGSSGADDAKGALPYGTYTIEELRVSGNAGLSLIRMPSLTIDAREGHVVNLGTFDNQDISACALTTFAREYRTGAKDAPADPETRIIDRVQYTNLDVTEGKAYELHASLVEAGSGAPITDADGVPVTGFARFVPTQQNGFAEVELAFDSRAFADKDVAVFEELVKSDTGAVIAEHKDASDYDQTVHIDGQLLQTSATDAYDGDKTVPADPEASICDTVSYRNLVAGEEYELRGSLWVKGDGDDAAADSDLAECGAEPLVGADGMPCTAVKLFVPEYADGNVEVLFDCDTSMLDGREVVVFEELYRAGQPIARHRDAYDAAQTVQVREPLISTVVADILDGDDIVSADGGSCVVDTVMYDNVIPGKEYTLNGELMRKTRIVGSSGASETQVESLTDSAGQPVTAQTDFVPETSSGQTQVTFEYDSRFGDGDDVVVYETLLRGETVLAEDCDPDNSDQSFSVHAASIWTYLDDARTATKQVTADSEAMLEDEVRYADAVIGEDYTAYGILVDAQTGLPILQHAKEADEAQAATEAEELMRELLAAPASPDAGESLAGQYAAQRDYPQPFDPKALAGIVAKHPDIAERIVTAKQGFNAERSAGTTMLTYALDARDLEGVQATSCVAVVKDRADEAVCTEMDLTNEDQTVTFVNGTIQTTATDATDGDHDLLNSTEARISDEVRYEGLTPGKEYILEGVLFDRSTGEALLVADKEVTASQYFVPAAANGSEVVGFTFDASQLAGREVVVYEYLYRQMDTGQGAERVLVALHADAHATEQTVRITGQDTALPATGYDQTGDVSGPVVALGAGCAVAAVLAGGYGIRQMHARNRRAQQAVERALRGMR